MDFEGEMRYNRSYQTQANRGVITTPKRSNQCKDKLQMAINNSTSITPVQKYHFVYGLIDPRNGVLFYVGITNNLKRRITEHVSNGRGKITAVKFDYFKQLKAVKVKPVVVILDEIETTNPRYVFRIEQLWITIINLQFGTLINSEVSVDIQTQEDAIETMTRYKALNDSALGNVERKILLMY